MLEKNFCSSPWFHIRMTYDGSFQSCRWASNPKRTVSFKNSTILNYYNSDEMRNLRQQLLAGDKPNHCSSCYYEESFGKLNGRLRQLNKSAIDVNNFVLTMRSSPHYKNFEYSWNNNGLADLAPIDLQIELGNTCNSACIMCSPEASSKLEQDYHKLNRINSKLFFKPNNYSNWTKDQKLIDRFVNEIVNIPNIKYIHFLGGETLYEEAFYTICEKLIASGLSKNIIIGTTTNGTIYNERIEKFTQNFKQFHLGISIESVTGLNDYIRWPGQIEDIIENIHKYLELRKTNSQLIISLRVTPNIFSIYELDKLFVFMLENQVNAESCNILNDPSVLRMELMPEDIRFEIKEKFKTLIDYYDLSKKLEINVRNPNTVQQAISNVILDYYQFIQNFPIPQTLEQDRYDLVKYIQAFETLRNNSILNYLPRYEKFLRSYGY